MRKPVVECFADSLAMDIVNETKALKVRGKKIIEFDLGDGLIFPFGLTIIKHFDNKGGGEAGLLLTGPGELYLLIGHVDHLKALFCYVLDGAILGKKMFWRDEVFKAGSVVRAAKKLRDLNAVRGSWTRSERIGAKWKVTTA